MENEHSTLAHWASEYPQYARLIHSPGWRRLFSAGPPPPDIALDEQWTALTQNLSLVSDESTGDEQSKN